MEKDLLKDLLDGTCAYSGIDKFALKKIKGFNGPSLYNTGILVSINDIPVAWYNYEGRHLAMFTVRKDFRRNGLGSKIIFDMYEPNEIVGIFMDENPNFWKSVSSNYVEDGFGYGISKITIKDKSLL